MTVFLSDKAINASPVLADWFTSVKNSDSAIVRVPGTDLRDLIEANLVNPRVSGKLLTGAAVPDAVGAEAGSITISTGDSGVTAPLGSSDDLVIENNASAGISILTPNGSDCRIVFGDPENSSIGRIIYNHVNDTLRFTANTGIALTIDSTQRLLTGTTVPDAVGAQAGSMTISTGNSGVTSISANADDLVIEGAGHTGITIASPNGAIGNIYFADPEGTAQGRVRYDHVANELLLSANNSEQLYISSDLIEQRRSTAAQEFRLYNTFTDASNYERAFMRFTNNVLEIGQEFDGTGSARAMRLLTGGTLALTIDATQDAVFEGSVEALANKGTAGTGTTAAEYGDGFNHITVLTMAGVLPSIAAGANAYGLLVYTFPAGVTRVKSIHMDVGIDGNETNIDTDTPDVGLGSTIATGSVSVLGGTPAFEDYILGSAAANCTGTVTDVTEDSVTAGIILSEAGGIKALHFNAAATWSGTDTAAALSGTITIEWTFLGA